jgi:UDP-N-acetylmuramoyl-tripeptide--D-alanyl-D-alanine ligase
MTVLWTEAELRAATGGAMQTPFAATGVSIDTRTLNRGDLFVALKGDHGDGHDHVAQALAKGAPGALVHRTDTVADAAKLLVVADTLEGLGALGRYGRARFTGRLVAVTGSVGKTTTKEMLRTILAAQGGVHAAEASYNNHWGVPLTLARLPRDATWCVAEIGMNHAGEIAPLSRMAAPDVAVITTVEAAHIGHLGSLEAIADEKAAIMAGLRSGGTAVLPADNRLLPRLRAAVPHGMRVITFGSSPNADMRLLSSEGDAGGSTARLEMEGHQLNLQLPAPGRHMVMNAMAALAATAALGADLDAAVRALSDFAAVKGRGARRPILSGRATLLDESYNASAASVRAALSVLRLLPAERRLAVLGDMLELGEHGPAEHAGLADAVAESADLLFACGPLMRHLFEALPTRLRGAHAADSAALAPIVARAVAPGDAVLVKGSLGSRMRAVVQALEEERA